MNLSELKNEEVRNRSEIQWSADTGSCSRWENPLSWDATASSLAWPYSPATSCTEFDSFGCVARAVRTTVHVHLPLTMTGQARFHKEGDPYGPHQ